MRKAQQLQKRYLLKALLNNFEIYNLCTRQREKTCHPEPLGVAKRVVRMTVFFLFLSVVSMLFFK
ncbi:MAG: hypothetical protein Tsb005_08300 [Gammaproteobacteria bacterium]